MHRSHTSRLDMPPRTTKLEDVEQSTGRRSCKSGIKAGFDLGGTRGA